MSERHVKDRSNEEQASGETDERRKKKPMQLILSIAVLLVAAAIGAYFFLTKEAAPKGEEEAKAVLVEVAEVERRDLQPKLSVKGSLQPARRLVLPAQVGGEIVWVHPDLEIGGLIERGETLAEIEKADFELAVRQAEAGLEEAQARLELEQGQQAIAREELEYFQNQADQIEERAREDLILREPQLRIARAAVRRAESDLDQAKLRLSRATIEAPFDCIIESESIEIGQIVQPGATIAEILGTAEAHVEARVPARHLANLDIPRWNAKEGSGGTATYQMGEIEIQREIRIKRLAGSLDRSGRMARLLCVLEDPFGFAEREVGPASFEDEEKRPMLFGAFIDVELKVAREQSLFEVPAGVIRNRGRLFVMTSEGKLAIREPEVFLRGPESIYLSSGLESGDRIVTSLIANPIEGMDLRTAEDQEAPEPDESEGDDSA